VLHTAGIPWCDVVVFVNFAIYCDCYTNWDVASKDKKITLFSDRITFAKRLLTCH
jgi:hypothetical protein